MFIFSSKTRSSLKFLTTKFFVLCYLVLLLIFHRADESGLQQQIAINYNKSILLNDEGSDTVFHA